MDEASINSKNREQVTILQKWVHKLDIKRAFKGENLELSCTPTYVSPQEELQEPDNGYISPMSLFRIIQTKARCLTTI